MKKLILPLCMLLSFLSGAVFVACTEKGRDPKKDVVLNYADSTFVGLSSEQAEFIASKYSRNYLTLINKNLNIDDARTIWFSLDELKKFIWNIEYHTLKTTDKVSTSQLGVRIYYAQNPSKEEIETNIHLKNFKIDYASRHTLFMVPTVRINDTTNIEFDPRQAYKASREGKFDGFVPLRKLKRNPKSSVPFKQVEPNDEENTILNHGTLCPPCIPPAQS
jgi:hypothetical protein